MKKSFLFQMTILSAVFFSFLIIAGCGGGGGGAVESGGGHHGSAAAPNIVFVTSASGKGDLGDLTQWPDAGGATGLAAGDAICQAAATNASPSLPGTYKAWLSDETTDAYCHIQGYDGTTIATNCGLAPLPLPVGAGPWVRTDGYPFADTIDKLVTITNAQIYTPVTYNENGAALVGGFYYFTGTNPDGTKSSGSTCTNWTVGNVSVSHLFGHSEATTDYWTAFGGTDCSTPRHLLCFQTGTGGPLPSLTPPASAKKVFVTSTFHNGNFVGRAGADTICQNRAAAIVPAVADPTKFKAWLSTSTSDAIDHITSSGPTSNGPWYRLDGVKVADNKTALAAVPLFTAISLDELGAYSTSMVWTGTAINGTATVNTCSDWTVDSVSFGTAGTEIESNYEWTAGWNSGCGATYALYCFED